MPFRKRRHQPSLHMSGRKKNRFAHLYNHSGWSSDGVCGPGSIAVDACSMHCEAVALTDFSTLAGIPEFLVASALPMISGKSRKDGIKPIIGAEFRIAEGDESILLLARDKGGYRNLIHLVTAANETGEVANKLHPRLSRSILSERMTGLICIMLAENEKDILSAWGFYQFVFGDDFYLGVFDSSTAEIERYFGLAKQVGVKVVALAASDGVRGFFSDEDCRGCGVSCGEVVLEPGKGKWTGRACIKTPLEMRRAFEGHEDAILNTVEIANKVECFDVLTGYHPPRFGISTEDDAAHLQKLVDVGAKSKWGAPLPPGVAGRLEHELGVIRKKGLSGYFLVVWDLVREARRKGIWCGPGRGSAVGSAVVYALGITEVDPFVWNLPFSRFLNEERDIAPDIDIDVEVARRNELFAYLAHKYGEDKVARIGSYVHFGEREVKELKRSALFMTDDDPRAHNVECLIRRKIHHVGVHSCGVVVSPRAVREVVPLIPGLRRGDCPMTQFDKRFVERVGLLKIDAIGLKTLTLQRRCVEMIQARRGKSIELSKIPLDDPLTMELFVNGKTDRIAQFRGDGIRNWLIALAPRTFDDIVLLNAFYRPGSMDYLPHICARKRGDEAFCYASPMLVRILKDTFGIFAYQEQLMQTAMELGGFSMSKADDLRRYMARKQLDKMEKLKLEFREGCCKNDVFVSGAGGRIADAKRIADTIWEDMRAISSYAFCRSHAIASTLLSFRAGYLRAHYPEEYSAAYEEVYGSNR